MNNEILVDTEEENDLGVTIHKLLLSTHSLPISWGESNTQVNDQKIMPFQRDQSTNPEVTELCAVEYGCCLSGPILMMFHTDCAFFYMPSKA